MNIRPSDSSSVSPASFGPVDADAEAANFRRMLIDANLDEVTTILLARSTTARTPDALALQADAQQIADLRKEDLQTRAMKCATGGWRALSDVARVELLRIDGMKQNAQGDEAKQNRVLMAKHAPSLGEKALKAQEFLRGIGEK